MKNLGGKINPETLKEYFKSRNYDVTIGASKKMVVFLKQGIVSKLIFDFGIDKLQILVDFLEEIEEYEILAVVRDRLKIHNKLVQRDFKLKNG